MWRVQGLNDAGAGSWSTAFAFTTVSSVATESGEVPTEWGLGAPYPNPFNPVATVVLDVPAPGTVRLALWDLSGRLAAVVQDGHLPAGRHERLIRARGLPSGPYVLRMAYPGGSAVQMVTLLK